MLSTKLRMGQIDKKAFYAFRSYMDFQLGRQNSFMPAYPWRQGNFIEFSASTSRTFTGIPFMSAWSPEGTFLAVLSLINTSGVVLDVLMPEDRASSDRPIYAIGAGSTGIGDYHNMSWSKDGRYIAVATGVPDGFSLFSRNFNEASGYIGFTNVSTRIRSMVGGSVQSVAWSPNGEFLAVAGSSSPFLKVYRYDGDFEFTDITVENAPTANLTTVDWFPDNTLIVGGTVVSSITYPTYRFNGDTGRFARQSALYNIIESGTVEKLVVSPKGNYVAMAHSGGQRFSIYMRVDSTNLVRISVPAHSPILRRSGITWHPSEEYFIASRYALPEDNDPFTLEMDRIELTNLSTRARTVNYLRFTPPTNVSINDVAWSPNGKHIAVSFNINNSSRITIYRTLQELSDANIALIT